MIVRILSGLIGFTLAYLVGVSGYVLEVLGVSIVIGLFIVWSANRRDSLISREFFKEFLFI